MLFVEASPLLLAAEPPGAAFPASGWKRSFKKYFPTSSSKRQGSFQAMPTANPLAMSGIGGELF
ncbi:hypothetical protein [Nostoc sp.]|uniref:hypothetical protein n=1 Tax=Nostoc sp. TaxID=1180 RepID=UPI002FF461E0